MKNKYTKREKRFITKVAALIGDRWNVYPGKSQNGGIYFELSGYSPAGENIVWTLWGNTIFDLARSAKKYYAGFDPEEHAAEIYYLAHEGDENQRRFYSAAPGSLLDLLKDAESQEQMIQDTMETLFRAA